MDEAIALPTDFSARIARETQLYLQHETNVTKTVDPWAGSYYVEKLTHDMVHKAWELMQEVENLGGMTKAIETGIPKTRIEEAAARKQARIDSEQDVIVGVNKYQLTEEDELQILEVDNKEVRRQQLQRLEEVKANRNTAVVAKKLKELTIAAKNKLDDSDSEENLLALAVSAARERATLGEISSALEEAFGRHKAIINSFTGVYSREIKEDKSFKKAQELADRFAQQDGRRPRIMVAKMGQDGHDRGAKVVATGYADLGFDVDIGPLFQTPKETAKQAVENDVHILGVSSLAGGHKTLVPEVIKELKSFGREDIMVIVGGVVPKQDYALVKLGLVAQEVPSSKDVYNIVSEMGEFECKDGTKISDAAIQLLELLLE